MAHSSSNSVQYTQFPTYRRSLLFRPSLTHSFTESHLSLSGQQEHQPSRSPAKRNPTLLHPSKLQRTPLKPCLSPQSPTPSSISRQSKIKDSESRLRKNLSDLESRLDHFSRPPTKPSSPSSSLSSLFLPHLSRTPSAGIERKTPEGNQHRLDSQNILAIFLKNNGGYLDDSEGSDDEQDSPGHQPPRLLLRRPPMSPLAGHTKQQASGSSRMHLNKIRPPQRTAAREASNTRSLSMNVT